MVIALGADLEILIKGLFVYHFPAALALEPCPVRNALAL